MESKYNNPRVSKIFPIEGRSDFFKFAVLEGEEIAKGADGEDLIFQDEERAISIVNSRKAVNHKLKVDAIRKEADEKIRLANINFEIEKKINLGASFDVFSNFVKVDIADKEQLRELIQIFPATEEPIKDQHIKDYNFNYKIGISNSAKGVSLGELRYNNKEIGSIWVQFPISFLDGFTTKGTRGASESEHVHFMGLERSQLRDLQISKVSFLGQSVKYYGGDEALKDAEIAKMIIEGFLK